MVMLCLHEWEKNLLFAILAIKANDRLCVFSALPDSYQLCSCFWFSNGKQIDVHTLDKRDPQDSK